MRRELLAWSAGAVVGLVAGPDPTTDDVTALARLIWETSRADESTISATGADIVAAAILRSPWLAERDARVRAEALREAADWLRDDMDEPWGMRAASRLDSRADRIERGESR